MLVYTADLTMARDFDLGMTGPPLYISMDFIATGLIQLVTGAVSAVVLFGYTWWAPLVLASAWIATRTTLLSICCACNVTPAV